ncbi:hypothetical protein A3765_07820 [Oleiphilus sp. HI0130]|jgi:hyperosmotically inducible protein|nr:hypothetical protein A3765_07820 [Oleiphilus sp. HI0130]
MNFNKSFLASAILSTAVTATVSGSALAGQGYADEMEGKLNSAWLDGKVEMALMLDKNLNNFEIDTTVVGTTAFLTGRVDNELDQRLAEEIAASVEGVTEVENNLTVAQGSAEAPIDEQLVDARVDAVLAMKLLLENEVTSKNIDIETEDGVVILSGSVPTQAEADLAIAIANNTSGVEKVESKLEVES